jgi:hypothetical protein
MNEQIFEDLARCLGVADEKGNYAENLFCFTKQELHSFAELIAAKCIKTIQNESLNSNDEWEDGLVIAQRAIKKHFGIQ